MKMLMWALGLLVFGVVAFSAFLGLAYLQLPDANDITKCPKAANSGRTLCPGNGSYTKLSQISEYLKQAILLSEDAAFYTHEGFDWSELKNSFQRNLEEGAYVRGGSTITQQLAKNVFLSSDKTLLRKLKEAILARRLEHLLSKNQILEYYLNVIEFGPGVYGIRQASSHYFGKHPSELDAGEAAYLAFLLPNPKVYSRSRYPHNLSKYANSRVQIILGRMHRYKRIPEHAYQQAIARMGGEVSDPNEIIEDEAFDEMNESALGEGGLGGGGLEASGLEASGDSYDVEGGDAGSEVDADRTYETNEGSDAIEFQGSDAGGQDPNLQSNDSPQNQTEGEVIVIQEGSFENEGEL